jgi:hypothetical protein
MKGRVEACLGEYGIDGWKVPDLLNPDDVRQRHGGTWLPAGVPPVAFSVAPVYEPVRAAAPAMRGWLAPAARVS